MQQGIERNTDFYDSVRSILQDARRQAYAHVNTVMIDAYWNIGQRIVEEEQQGAVKAGYGEALLQGLSRALTDEFGKGFSYANLKNFRQFYMTFPELGKSYALRSELTWTHYRLIMRVRNPQEREFYIQEAADQAWSSRQLERNIQSGWHKRILQPGDSSPDRSADSQKPAAFVKDPYVLEFLDLTEDPGLHEKALETAIIEKLQQFLLELGKGFSFVGRQFRISSETSHFYIDLVFYNYLLKCFVLIDLKTGKLTHQDIGQMDMYVRMFDDLKRGEDDNPTLGIILCADKDETVVRYSVLHDSEQLFASKYLRVLPSEKELAYELEKRHVLGAGGDLGSGKDSGI